MEELLNGNNMQVYFFKINFEESMSKRFGIFSLNIKLTA